MKDSNIGYLAWEAATDAPEVAAAFTGVEGVAAVIQTGSQPGVYDNGRGSTAWFAWGFVLGAVVLLLAAVFSLGDANMTSRMNEAGALKRLGYRDGELTFYMLRENILTTGLGVLAGLLCGMLLHPYVVHIIEAGAVMSARAISPLSYLWAALLALAVVALASALHYLRVRRMPALLGKED